MLRDRDTILPNCINEHSLQRTGHWIAGSGFFEKGEAELNRLRSALSVSVVPYNRITDLDQTQKLERGYIRAGIKIPILHQELPTCYCMLDDKVSKLDI